MPTIKLNQLKRGNVVNYNGDLCRVIEMNYRNPGNLNAFFQCKIRSLSKGNQIPIRWAPHDTVELVVLDTRPMTFLYKEGDGFVFMDSETYDQVSIPADLMGDDALYLIDQMECAVTFHGENPIGVDLPFTVDLVIAEAEVAAKGDTVTNSFKSATCVTGLEVKVPMFVVAGDVVKVDTRTGEFLQRVTQNK